MPLGLVVGVVIDSHRRAEGYSTICAAGEHHLGGALAVREYAGKHVDVVVSRPTGTVHCQERLPTKSYSIYAALNEVATEVDGSVLIEIWRDVRVLRIGRAKTVEGGPSSANKKIAVRVNVERSGIGKIWKTDRSLPGGPAVGGPAESAEFTSKELGPELVLEPVTRSTNSRHRRKRRRIRPT